MPFFKEFFDKLLKLFEAHLNEFTALNLVQFLIQILGKVNILFTLTLAHSPF
jgi:hypothetical protein